MIQQELTDLQTLIDEDGSNYINLTSNYVGILIITTSFFI